MQQDPTQAMGLLAVMGAVYLIVIVLVMIAIIIPTWFICKKAGFTPWLSLLVMVPLGGLVLLYVLAFAEWKVVPAPQQGYWPPQAQPAQPPQALPTQQPPYRT
jgi:hypothetical protein